MQPLSPQRRARPRFAIGSLRRAGLARLAVLMTILGLFAAVGLPASAQPMEVDTAQSEEVIDTLGYPEIEITAGPDGVTAPDTLAAGHYLVTLSAPEPYVAYVDFMQPPAGLSDDEALELAQAAAQQDLAQHGWVYAGGNNTFETGVPVKFIVALAPGEYRIAASYYELGAEDEVMQLLPLTVTESATPASAEGPDATVTLDMTDDLRYTVSPDPVPAGPQVWEVTNSGEHHAHHAVVFRTPDDVTADDIVADFASLMSGTPPAGPPLISQFQHVGYAALQSGGQTTWIELDLEPGTYAVICFIVDPATGMPHVINGMATTFTVG
jgi:hypothetical protein